MRVHLQHEPEAQYLAQLQAVAGVCTGEPADDIEVWVGGSLPETPLPNLKAVIVPWAGIPESLRQNLPEGVRLFNLHHNDMATAEMAVALLLAVARRIVTGDQNLRQGVWQGRQDGTKATLLAGKTATIYGYGAIGRQVGRVLEALGMGVIGLRRSNKGELEQTLRRSHALVVTAPLTDETRGAIGRSELTALLPPRLVVNVGRGPIIDEEALYSLCQASEVRLGSDVWYQYPKDDEPAFPSPFPFHELPNVVLSPHRGGDGDDADRLRYAALAELLRDLADGRTPKEVDRGLGY